MIGLIQKKTYAASTFTDMEMLEFVIELTENHYLNFSNIVLCLPITFRKTTNKAQAIDGDMIPVNNFLHIGLRTLTLKDMEMT